MNECYRVWFLSLFLVVCLIHQSENKIVLEPNDTWNGTARNAPPNRVGLKVFYETLCPGSISFFMRDLRPTVEHLSPYLDLHLVPYGFAMTRKTSAGYRFVCQHGQDECFGNRVHACVVDQLADTKQAALINACLMNNYKASRITVFDFMLLVWCQRQLNVNLDTHRTWECAHSDRSSLLLKRNGDETRAWRPAFMPYVAMYDSVHGLEEGITGGLMNKICTKLNPAPPTCYTNVG